MKIEELYRKYLTTTGISTDTRNISHESMFFALNGERFDANEFASIALEKGAKYAVIDNEKYFINDKTILVKNSLETLQKLASYHRDQLKNIKIIGLTGSNGKTTTKELFFSVLNKKYKTLATLGNLNNHIGVPLTLLRFKNDTEIGIVEMGANHQKEISFLSSICKPDIGYITNFGKAHLEGFGGEIGVIKGKSELYDFIENNNKVALINLDDPIQSDKTANIKRFSFSTSKESDIKIQEVTANPMVNIKYNDISIQSNLIGLYNANNINASIAIGKYFNIEDEDIKDAIEKYIPQNNRSQIIDKNSNKIILDAYNANPSSMQVALANFFQLSESPKIAILGDMFELGSKSKEEHENIIKTCQKQVDIEFFFIGKQFFNCKKTANEKIKFYEDFESFKNYLSINTPKNYLILIKGSRGMSLERTLEYL